MSKLLPAEIFMNCVTEAGAGLDSKRGSLASQVEALVRRMNPGVLVERRRDERIAIPVFFRLTPLDADRHPVECDAVIVVGKNISRRGLSFFHEHPIPYRRAIITLAQPGLGHFDAEIDVSWCRFTRPGWYESGGRLVRAAIQNLEPHELGTDTPVVHS